MDEAAWSQHVKEGNVSALTALLSEHASILPLYRLQRFQSEIDAVRKSQAPPAKKFSFAKTAKQSTAAASRSAGPSASTPESSSKGPTKSFNNAFVQAHDLDDNESSSLTLTNSSDSVLSLRSSSSTSVYTLYCTRLDRCTLILPRSGLRGSLFVHGCNDCVFVGQAQQLRIHSSRGCLVVMPDETTCQPIVEDCHDLRFHHDFNDPFATTRAERSIEDLDKWKALLRADDLDEQDWQQYLLPRATK